MAVESVSWPPQIHLGRGGVGSGGGKRRAIGAEQIKVVTGIASDLALIVPAMRQEGLERLGKTLVEALARLGNGPVGGEVRIKRGTRLLGRGVGFLDARVGDADVGAAGEAFGDQAIELGILISGPPVLTGPLGRGRHKCLLAGEARFAFGLGQGAQVGRAAGKQAERQDRQQDAIQQRSLAGHQGHQTVPYSQKRIDLNSAFH